MTTNDTNQLRIESILTENFCINVDKNGKRTVASNGYILPYETFCVILIWSLSNTMCYLSILGEQSDIIENIKNNNKWDTVIQNLDNKSVIKRICSVVITSLISKDSKDIEERFLQLINE